VTAGTVLGHVCPAVGCPGRGSRRPGLGWCRRSNGERRNWLFPLGCTTVQGCWMLPRTPDSHRPRIFFVTPVDLLAIEVANVQAEVWERRDGRWCESRAWSCILRRSCIVRRPHTTTQSLIVLETDRPVTIPTARGQTWQCRDSCSGLTQLVRSW